MRAVRLGAILLAATACALVSTGCKPQKPSTGAGVIVGRVADVKTGTPIAGAHVTALSQGKTTAATTDASGIFHFDSLAPGEYTVATAESGYARRVLHVTVAAGREQALQVELGAAQAAIAGDSGTQPASAIPPPPPPPAPPPPGGPSRAIPAPGAVHDSLLGLFNAAHPVHLGNEPYFGRYSYVLLHDGDDAAKAKNLAFVTKLVDLYAASGSSISFDASAHTDNPLSYNVFFFPVHDDVSAIKVSVHTGAAGEVLNAYDFDGARTLREAYCRVPAHASRSICTIPYGPGPILVTFLQPLPANVTDATIPPAFAYDFSAISADQCDAPLATVQKKIAVPEGVKADTVLPPPLAAHVANELDLLVTAIDGAFKGVSFWIDKQPGADHGK